MDSFPQLHKQGALPFVLTGTKLNSSNRFFAENERFVILLPVNFSFTDIVKDGQLELN